MDRSDTPNTQTVTNLGSKAADRLVRRVVIGAMLATAIAMGTLAPSQEVGGADSGGVTSSAAGESISG